MISRLVASMARTVVNVKRAPRPVPVLGADASDVRLDESLADGELEPGTCGRAGALAEEVREPVGRNPAPPRPRPNSRRGRLHGPPRPGSGKTRARGAPRSTAGCSAFGST